MPAIRLDAEHRASETPMNINPASLKNLPTVNNRASAAPPSPKHNALVKQSQHLVAQTFYGTMLKQMRESPFKSELFDGGRGGEMFSSLLDQRLADHMSKSTGNKLVNSIVKHIEHPHGSGALGAALMQKAVTAKKPQHERALQMLAPTARHSIRK